MSFNLQAEQKTQVLLDFLIQETLKFHQFINPSIHHFHLNKMWG